MDVTDATNQRLELGIEEFLKGDSLAYENVVFCWIMPFDARQLLVISYSDWHEQETVQRDEAQRKIERSKRVALELASRSNSFAKVWQEVPKRFQFCLDCYTGAVVLAEEDDGKVIWKDATHGESR